MSLAGVSTRATPPGRHRGPVEADGAAVMRGERRDKDDETRGCHTLHFPHDASAGPAVQADLSSERSIHG